MGPPAGRTRAKPPVTAPQQTAPPAVAAPQQKTWFSTVDGTWRVVELDAPQALVWPLFQDIVEETSPITEIDEATGRLATSFARVQVGHMSSFALASMPEDEITARINAFVVADGPSSTNVFIKCDYEESGADPQVVEWSRKWGSLETKLETRLIKALQEVQ